MRKIFSALLTAALVLGFYSCEEAEVLIETSVETVSLNKSSLTLSVDSTYTLTATVTPEEATDKSLVWESSDEEVATVSQAGVVLAIAEGEATITASSVDKPSVYAECLVSVTKEIVTPDDPDNPDDPDATGDLTLANIDAENLPESDTWVIVDTVADSGVREISLDGTGNPSVGSDGTYSILGDGEFKPLWDALMAASDEGRKISVEFPNLLTIPHYAFFDIELYNQNTSADNFVGDVPTSLVSVKAPVAVEIGRGAFRETYSLEEIELPEVEEISELAFRMATSLKSISFDKVTVIDDGAFGFCTGIQTASLPKVQTIGENAFYFCDGIQSLELPELVEAKLQAFRGCDAMVKFSAPKLETIGEGAFAYCQTLSEVDFSSVQSVGVFSFYNNTRLTMLEMPEVQTIGRLAFYYCYTMNTVKFPKATSVGEEAFGWCSSLEFITLATESSSLTLDANVFNNFSVGNVNLKTGTSNGTTVSELMWTVGGYTFGPFKSINDESIPDEPYGENYTLADIPTNGASIENDIWIIDDETAASSDDFARLRTAVLSAGRNISLEFPNLTALPDDALLDADNGLKYLSSISMPVVKSIGDRALYGCSVLKTVSIPEATSLGIYTFGTCAALTALDLPQVSEIGAGAFYKCSNLSSIVVNPDYYYFEDKVLYSGDKSLLHTFLASNTSTSFTADASVKEVKGQAFMECTTIKTVDLPGVVTIGEYAFLNCSALTTFSGASAENFDQYVFQKCKLLSTIDLPEAKTFGKGVFTECYALKSVTLPKAETIGEYTFFVCGGLTSISLPVATTLEYGAFYSCYSLVTVDAPNVVTVGAKAFEQCSAMKTISLPKAESFGVECFSFCYLETVEIPMAKVFGERVFVYCTALTSLTVATESVVESLDETMFNAVTLSNLDLITGTRNNTTIDEFERTWTCGSVTFGPFKSVATL